jgi:N-acetylmuramoyl-L-alanine amidase
LRKRKRKVVKIMSKKVALMCGHGKSTNGSWDPGTTYGGHNEAALMLPITKAAVKYLRSYGVTVISDADTNNNKNMIVDVAWANKEKCDIYVSVHCDYFRAPSGVMPLFVSSKGKKLATALNNAVKSGMGMKSRGVVRRTDLWELNGTDMVACILETGSIKADINILKNKPDAYGKCIAKGICDYLGIKAEAPAQATAPTQAPAKELYRVRKSWNEPKTQKGAFNNLEHAKQCADVNGINVYDSTGKLVYSGKKKSTPTKTKREKIADMANKLCYPDARKESKYPSGKPTAAYKSALASLPMSKHKWCKAARDGANCDVFVWVDVVKSGVDKNFPSGLWKQLNYMKKHYTRIKVADAKPGDIGFYRKNVSGAHGHIFIVYSNGQVKEASHNSYYPRTNKSLSSRLSSKGKKYVYVFRPK